MRHELEDAAAARERLSKKVAQQEQERAARVQYAAELALLVTQDTALAASEADLSKRLWEVQEVRRRHAAMATQLRAAIARATGMPHHYSLTALLAAYLRAHPAGELGHALHP